jgi:hypothetical protein
LTKSRYESVENVRLTSAGLAVTASGTGATAAGLLASLLNRLLTVVAAASVAVTES